MPYALCTAFSEAREYAQLQAQYHDGTTERSQLAATSRRTFNMGRRLGATAAAALKTFWDGQQGGLIPFLFYNLIEGPYDPTGAATLAVHGRVPWQLVPDHRHPAYRYPAGRTRGGRVSDCIGRIQVPALVDSGLTFSLRSDMGYGFSQERQIVVHRFGELDAKAEQRFATGIGPRKHAFRRQHLSKTDRNTLASFWE